MRPEVPMLGNQATHLQIINMATEFPLHEKVFCGDIKEVSKLLRTYDVSQKDMHGIVNLTFVQISKSFYSVSC